MRLDKPHPLFAQMPLTVRDCIADTAAVGTLLPLGSEALANAIEPGFTVPQSIPLTEPISK